MQAKASPIENTKRTKRIRIGGPGAGFGDRLPVLPNDGSGPEVWPALADYEAKRIQRVFKYLVPILSVAILATEIAPFFSPEFPRNPVLSLAVVTVLAISWKWVLRGANRKHLGLLVCTLTIGTAAYVGIACAQSGGFRSMHTLATGCTIMVFPCLGAMGVYETVLGTLGSIAAWSITVIVATPGPIDWDAFGPGFLYLSAFAALGITTVWQGRKIRITNFVANRRSEALHRFAVEEVLCRHLPPSYVEEVLSGSRTVEAPPERKILTVLFADVVNFSVLAENCEPEELASVMAAYYDIAARKAFEYGGTVDKFIGDAVMVLFGAPDSMSPDTQAQQALGFAKDLHEEVCLLELPDGQAKADLRIGLHQDVVIVGNFGGSLRVDFTALGRGVNLAARLEQNAANGQILTSERFHDRLPARVRTQGESGGLMQFKGIGRKVQTWSYSPSALDFTGIDFLPNDGA